MSVLHVELGMPLIRHLQSCGMGERTEGGREGAGEADLG